MPKKLVITLEDDQSIHDRDSSPDLSLLERVFIQRWLEEVLDIYLKHVTVVTLPELPGQLDKPKELTANIGENKNVYWPESIDE